MVLRTDGAGLLLLVCCAAAASGSALAADLAPGAPPAYAPQRQAASVSLIRREQLGGLEATGNASTSGASPPIINASTPIINASMPQATGNVSTSGASPPIINASMPQATPPTTMGDPASMPSEDPLKADAPDTGAPRYVALLRQDANDLQLDHLCNVATEAGAACTARGHPNAGGVPFAALTATFTQMLAIQESVDTDLISVVEQNAEVKAATTLAEEGVNCSYQAGAENPWHLRRIKNRIIGGGSEFKRIKKGGRGSHIYVVGSGLYFKHKEVLGRAIPAVETFEGVVHNCSFHDRSCAGDEHGSGTGFASLAAGKRFGVATGAFLHAAKSLDGSGRGSLSTLLLALDWIATLAHKPAVVLLGVELPRRSEIVDAAVKLLVGRNMTTVAAAGDGNGDSCDYSPASGRDAIIVSGTAKDDSYDPRANKGECVDLLAPADGVTAGLMADTSCRCMRGTGISAALVAGTVALYLADDRSRSPAEIQHCFLDDASDYPKYPSKMLFIGPPQGRTAPGALQPAEELALYPYDVLNWATATYGASPVCRDGNRQSPIDLPPCRALIRLPMEVEWDSADKPRIVSTGVTFQIELMPNSSVTTKFGWQRLSMRYCRFHAGSDHTIDGEQYSLEMQCYHSDDNETTLGAVSFLFEANNGSSPNEFLAEIEDMLPVEGRRFPLVREHRILFATKMQAALNFKKLVDASRLDRYFSYTGSVSTPPCKQGVSWLVLAEPLSMSEAQLAKFREAMHDTNTSRPPQSLEKRCVRDCSGKCAYMPSNDTNTSVSVSNETQWKPPTVANVSLSFLFKADGDALKPDQLQDLKDSVVKSVMQVANVDKSSITVSIPTMSMNNESTTDVHGGDLPGMLIAEDGMPQSGDVPINVVVVLENSSAEYANRTKTSLSADSITISNVDGSIDKTSFRSAIDLPVHNSTPHAVKPATASTPRVPELVFPAWKRNFGNSSCPCIGVAGLSGDMDALIKVPSNGTETLTFVPYPMDTGTSCHAWDDHRYPGACEDPTQAPGLGSGWCAQPWCYVDPCACDLETPPVKSTYFPAATYQGRPLFYSYATCGGNEYLPYGNRTVACVNQDDPLLCNAQPDCKWSQARSRCIDRKLADMCFSVFLEFQVGGSVACKCVGIRGLQGMVNVNINNEPVEYKSDHGSICEAWDDGAQPFNCTDDPSETNQTPGKGHGWCADRWCYVDPCQCHLSYQNASYLPEASFQGRRLALSYAACKDESPKLQSRYMCTTMTTQTDCLQNGEGECSWTPVGCISKKVLPTCHANYAGDKWPRTTTTTSGVSMVSLEAFGDMRCPCVGISGLAGLTQASISADSRSSYPMDVGSRCEPWDDGRFRGACEQEGETPGQGLGWCRMSWCYVDPCNCNLKELPVKSEYFPNSRYKGRPLYYSYATCGFSDAERRNAAEAPVPKSMCGSYGVREECDRHYDHCRWLSASGAVNEGRCVTVEVADTCDIPWEDQVLGRPACACVGISGLPGATTLPVGDDVAEYPGAVGSICFPWDLDVHPECAGQTSPPAWCRKRYCFVDACTCESTEYLQNATSMPHAVSQGHRIYKSYLTCDHVEKFTAKERSKMCTRAYSEEACALRANCSWTGNLCVPANMSNTCKTGYAPSTTTTTTPPLGHWRCPCIGISGMGFQATLMQPDRILRLPEDYGSSCKAWDDGIYPEACENPEQNPGLGKGWCVHRWCYVDVCNCDLNELPRKATLVPSAGFRNQSLYYSYETCGNKFFWSDHQASKNVSCKERKDKVSCSQMEGCTWMLVEEESDDQTFKCVGTEQTAACLSQPKDPIRYGQESCKCIGIGNLGNMSSGSVEATIRDVEVHYPSNVGTECRAWDSGLYPGECDGSVATPADWCEKKWCFVDPCHCTIDVPIKPASRFPQARINGAPVHVSYSTCETAPPEKKEEVQLCHAMDTMMDCDATPNCVWVTWSRRCIDEDLAEFCSGTNPVGVMPDESNATVPHSNAQIPAAKTHSAPSKPAKVLYPLTYQKPQPKSIDSINNSEPDSSTEDAVSQQNRTAAQAASTDGSIQGSASPLDGSVSQSNSSDSKSQSGANASAVAPPLDSGVAQAISNDGISESEEITTTESSAKGPSNASSAENLLENTHPLSKNDGAIGHGVYSESSSPGGTMERVSPSQAALSETKPSRGHTKHREERVKATDEKLSAHAHRSHIGHKQVLSVDNTLGSEAHEGAQRVQKDGRQATCTQYTFCPIGYEKYADAHQRPCRGSSCQLSVDRDSCCFRIKEGEDNKPKLFSTPFAIAGVFVLFASIAACILLCQVRAEHKSGESDTDDG